MNLKLGKDDEKLRQVADALFNKKRLEILKHINGERSHKEIAELCKIESSSITYHLTPLIAAGIVEEEAGKGSLGRKNKIPKIKIKGTLGKYSTPYRN